MKEEDVVLKGSGVGDDSRQLLGCDRGVLEGRSGRCDGGLCDDGAWLRDGGLWNCDGQLGGGVCDGVFCGRLRESKLDDDTIRNGGLRDDGARLLAGGL